MFVVLGVVDEGETGGAAATKFSLEAEHGDALVVGLEFLSELAADSVLRHVCHLGVHKLNRLITRKGGKIGVSYGKWIFVLRGLRANLRIVFWQGEGS